jgi:hypothetical protein
VAIGATLLTSAYSGTDSSTTYTTASVSPAANSLMVLFTSTVSGSLAWHAVPTSAHGVWVPWGHRTYLDSPPGARTRRVGVWTLQCGASPGAGAVTLTLEALGSVSADALAANWAIIEVTGHHVLNPVRQAAVAPGTVATATSHTITLSDPVDANSRPFAWFSIPTNASITHRTNWTELSDDAGNAPAMTSAAQWRSDAFETTASATFSTTEAGGIAIEIAEAAAANDPRAMVVGRDTTLSIADATVTARMPTNIDAGDLLVAAVSTDGAATATAGGGEGWTQISAASNGSEVRLTVLAKIAAGSDALSLTLGSAVDSVTHVMRIINHDVSNVATDIPIGTAATGTSSTPNPPSVTPAANETNLFLALAAADDDDEQNVFVPTSYTGEANVGSAALSATTAHILAAYRYVTTGSAQDPGTFTLAASEEWVAQTLCIPPGVVVNLAPVVNAGTNQTITFPAVATLVGSATDDGLPDPPDTLTITWTKVSGPGTVTFGDASDPTTTATFSTVGVYVLRLTADDSELDTSDDIQITVEAPSLPVFDGFQTIVEVQWDGVNWTNITEDIREMSVRLPSRSRLQAVFQAGSASIVLDNRTRKYDPLYASGPFFGDLKANRPMRVNFGEGGGPISNVFTGWTDGWSFAYDKSNNDATATITCIDALAKAGFSAIPAGTTPALAAGEYVATRGDALVTAAGATDITYSAGSGYARFGTTWDATVQHNLLTELRRCAELEVAPLLALDDGTLHQEARYWFATRALSATSNCTIPSATLPCTEVRVLYDARELVSAVSMTDEVGNVATATNAAAVTEFGERYADLNFNNMPAGDASSLAGAAATWVGLRGGEEMRFDTVTILPQRSDDWWEHINERRPLDRVTVSLTPTGVGDPITEDAFIDGIEHHITVDSWVTTWHLLPADLYAAVDFFILDTDELDDTKVLGY